MVAKVTFVYVVTLIGIWTNVAFSQDHTIRLCMWFYLGGGGGGSFPLEFSNYYDVVYNLTKFVSILLLHKTHSV